MAAPAPSVLRTPDGAFSKLEASGLYPFDPHYVHVTAALRMHFIDVGPRDGHCVMMMHGEPSWSFLWRNTIPPLLRAGFRVVCPDLIGFGKSDKPKCQEDHTYEQHVAWMRSFVTKVNIRRATLVVHDWGGLIGLRVAAAEAARFDRIVVTNSGLPTGEQKMPEAFLKWREFSRKVDPFPTAAIIAGATTTELSDDVLDAYEAPFPSEDYKAACKIMPSLVPIAPDGPSSAEDREAWKVLCAWKKPLLTAFSDSDPITAGGYRVFQKLVPGAQGVAHATLEGGGHFLQEDVGERLGSVIVKFVSDTPAVGKSRL